MTSEVLISKDQLIIADWRQQALENGVYMYDGVMREWYQEEEISLMAVAKVDNKIVGAALLLPYLKTYSWTNPLNFGVCVILQYTQKGFGRNLYNSIMENADVPVVVDGNSRILKRWALTPLKLVV